MNVLTSASECEEPSPGPISPLPCDFSVSICPGLVSTSPSMPKVNPTHAPVPGRADNDPSGVLSFVGSRPRLFSNSS